MAIFMLESGSGQMCWNETPPKSGPEKSRPTSSLSWAGRRDNEEHGTTQEMLNCISQYSAAGTRDREGREYKMHKTCALPKVISTAKNY